MDRYIRKMPRKPAPPPSDASPMSHWVYNAMQHADMSQTELAGAMYNRRVIASNDKSIPNKIVRGIRDVSAEEAMAISEITGFPPLNDGQDIVQTVPIISWVSAGKLLADDVRDEAVGTIKISSLPPGDWIALTVSGSSMDRISPPESIIFIDRRDKQLVPNGLYVIDDGSGNATYKRYRPDPARFEPVSTDAAHETIFPDNEPLIIGRVKRSMIDM
jgi:SOS-response transcriptional repressor LexA